MFSLMMEGLRSDVLVQLKFRLSFFVFTIIVLINLVSIFASPYLEHCRKPIQPQEATLPPITDEYINPDGHAHHAPNENRYKKRFLTETEMRIYELKHKHEFMTEEERNIYRREIIEEFLSCPQGPLQEHESIECSIPGLHISLMYRKGLTFCRNCLDAHESGSFVHIWDSHYGPMNYHIDGVVVYGVPNHGEIILNVEHTRNRVVLLDRGGGVPLVTKVLNAQKAGAVAVIIVDDGKCSSQFDCGALGSKLNQPYRGFSAKDQQHAWSEVYIPSVLVHSADGKRLKDKMDLETIRVPGFGTHWMNSGITKH